MRFLDDPQLLLERMLATRTATAAQRSGRDGLFCGSVHLRPTWTLRCARVGIIDSEPAAACAAKTGRLR